MCVQELVNVIVTVLTQVGSWSVEPSQAWCPPKSTGGNKFGLKLILKIGKIQMAKVAEVFMKIPVVSKEKHVEQKVFLQDL